MDIKAAIQDKAEQIASERFDLEFCDLDDDSQLVIYEEASQLVYESLQSNADSFRKEKELRQMEAN